MRKEQVLALLKDTRCNSCRYFQTKDYFTLSAQNVGYDYCSVWGAEIEVDKKLICDEYETEEEV